MDEVPPNDHRMSYTCISQFVYALVFRQECACKNKQHFEINAAGVSKMHRLPWPRLWSLHWELMLGFSFINLVKCELFSKDDFSLFPPTISSKSCSKSGSTCWRQDLLWNVCWEITELVSLLRQFVKDPQISFMLLCLCAGIFRITQQCL